MTEKAATTVKLPKEIDEIIEEWCDFWGLSSVVKDSLIELINSRVLEVQRKKVEERKHGNDVDLFESGLDSEDEYKLVGAISEDDWFLSSVLGEGK